MQIRNWRITGDWGHVTFATVIAMVTWWYFQDVTETSMNRNNIILVYPLSIMLLALYVVVLLKTITVRNASKADDRTTKPLKGVESDGPQTNEQDQSLFDMFRALMLLLLLGGFVFSYNVIGLDMATFIFIASSLFLLGYRRWWFIGLYALVFTLVVIGAADLLLSYPMPMMFL